MPKVIIRFRSICKICGRIIKSGDSYIHEVWQRERSVVHLHFCSGDCVNEFYHIMQTADDIVFIVERGCE